MSTSNNTFYIQNLSIYSQAVYLNIEHMSEMTLVVRRQRPSVGRNTIPLGRQQTASTAGTH